MADKLEKTTMNQVNTEILPYISTHIFGKNTIDGKNVATVSSLLLRKYRNVEIQEDWEPGFGGRPLLKIRVKRWYGVEENTLIITGKYKKKDMNRWIDDMEGFLAAVED